MKHSLLFVLVLWHGISLSGCSGMVSSASERIADSLAAGVVNQQDPEMVAQGLPAYLLLLDGLIIKDPENPGLLQAAADLNSAYAGQFTIEPERQRLLSAKALDYAQRALCLKKVEACALQTIPFKELTPLLATMDSTALPFYYSLGAAWAGWIQANSSDWNAVAQLSRVEAIMKCIVDISPQYKDGGAYLYLGVMASLIPPAMGGHPEEAKRYFEQAIQLSQGRNLMAKVYYARYYARLLFKQALHDRLLDEVLSATTIVEGLTLTNTLAKQEAQVLLESGKDYF